MLCMHFARGYVSEKQMAEQEITELTVQWTGIPSRQALLALTRISDIKAKTFTVNWTSYEKAMQQRFVEES
jgi:hypothetical protein